MKTLILAAFLSTVVLAGCSITEPGERVYYPRERAYNAPFNDPYANSVYGNRYSTRRVYDYNTGRYYDVPVYSSPLYNTPVYKNPTYRNRPYPNNTRRDNGRRDWRDNERRNNFRDQPPRTFHR